jgi:hypothetical protein
MGIPTKVSTNSFIKTNYSGIRNKCILDFLENMYVKNKIDSIKTLH